MEEYQRVEVMRLIAVSGLSVRKMADMTASDPDEVLAMYHDYHRKAKAAMRPSDGRTP